MVGSRKLSKVLSVLLVVTMLMGSLVNSDTAYADSNDRISTFINLAAGKNTTDIDLTSVSLSEQDLRFLGVYISNFFVPFVTELGNSGDSEEDVLTMNKEDIKKALQTNINFSDSLADSLTETLLGLSRSSIEYLELCVSKEYQGDLIPVSSSGANMPLNYYTALTCMLGGLKEMVGWYDKPNSAMEGIKRGVYEYGYFAYKNGDEYIPVFDFCIDGSELTASSAAFIKCLESADMNKGYGFSFFDFTKSELGDSNSDYEDKLNSLSNGEIYSMSVYGTGVAVDCFGNIILMGGNHQFIAVPGCMNPYSWVAVDEDGNDIGDNSIGGTAFNMINIPSMSMYESSVNKLFTGSVSRNSGEKTIYGTVNTEKFVANLCSVTDVVRGPLGIFDLRQARGDSESDFSVTLDWLGKNSSLRKLAKSAEKGFISANPKAYNYFNSSDGGIVDEEAFKSDTQYIQVYGVPLSLKRTQITDKPGRSIDVYDSFVYIDSLGAYHFDESSELADYSTFNVESYTDGEVEMEELRESMGKWGSSKNNGFTNTYNNIKNGDMVIPSSAVSKEGMVGIYVTYAFSSLYDEYSEDSKRETIGKLGYRLNSNALPEIPDEPLILSAGATEDMMESAIRNWTYYLLHPTEGLDYFKIWLRNKVNSFLLGWHEDMVGTNGTGSINGTTKYRGFSGYVTTPELTDIPWVNSLLNTFNSAIPFLLIIMVLIMLGAYIVGVLSLQKAIIGFMIFAICIALPSPIINSTVGTANRFSSSLYGEKFTYWALVQHESYSSAIDSASSGSSYSNYLKTLYETNSLASGNQGSESIMIKWQAPKKMASLMLTNKDESVLSGISSSLLGGLLNSAYSGESYLNDKDSVYLYRSYIDIANFSRYIHRGLVEGKQPINQNITNDTMRSWSNSLKDSIRNFGTSYEADRRYGYTNINKDGSYTGLSNNIIRVRLPLSSDLVNEQLANKGTLGDMSLNEYVGINQDAFNFSVPMFNVGEKELDFTEELKTDYFNSSKYSDEDFSALASFGLMSENPFYYFSWYLYETGLEEETTMSTGYKNLLLGQDNAGFFYNVDGNGEMKDFMDMKSLFTYIIPYLRECNELVYEWDDIYGIYFYEGVPTDEGHKNDPEIKGNSTLEQKYWHNLNVARLYNMYTPWVDVMYDCSYANAETVKYLGEKYVIADPINPNSYPEERPMVFSRSEMYDYGLDENDLTQVEKLIIECQEGMQERLFKLLNYHTFNDVVLNTAAAINCAFEFNTTFSENSIIGANHNIYPQSFELNDFSYDAFLRFILSNSTGDSMAVDEGKDFYSIIVGSSNMTTAIVMLVLDVLAMYVIPGFKIFFIVGIFLMSILIILSSAFRVDEQQKFILKFIKSFVKPVVQFLAVTCGMSLIVSWFMGEGSIGVTGSMETSIALGDPVMVILVMIVLNCFVVYLYFKILQGVWKDIGKMGVLTASFVGGVIGSSVGFVKGRLSKAYGGKTGVASGSKGGRVTVLGGEGKSNPRAKQRGSSGNVFDNEKKAHDDGRRERLGGIKNDILNKREKGKDSKVNSSVNIEEVTKKGMENIKSGSK